MKQASNIREQLKEYLAKVKWDELRPYFKRIKSVKEAKMDMEERGKLLTRALSEGFFMNTARRVPHHAKEGAYLTVHEGLMVKLDRSSVLSTNNEYPDWVIYTELSSTTSGATGLMKLAS